MAEIKPVKNDTEALSNTLVSIMQALNQNRVALAKTTHIESGETAWLLCAISDDLDNPGSTELVPYARLYPRDNPFVIFAKPEDVIEVQLVEIGAETKTKKKKTDTPSMN